MMFGVVVFLVVGFAFLVLVVVDYMVGYEFLELDAAFFSGAFGMDCWPEGGGVRCFNGTHVCEAVCVCGLTSLEGCHAGYLRNCEEGDGK